MEVRFIKPSVKFLKSTTNLSLEKAVKLLAQILNICYRNEKERSFEDALKFVKAIAKKGHTSFLEHVSVFDKYNELPVKNHKFIDYDEVMFEGRFLNGRTLWESLREKMFSPSIFANTPLNSDGTRLLFFITTDIGTLLQITRHRTLSFTVESTRYTNYLKKGMDFIEPNELYFNQDDDIIEKVKEHCINCANLYEQLIKEGCEKQQARQVLPKQQATRLYVSGTKKWLKEFVKTRTGEGVQAPIKWIAEEISKYLQ